MSEHDNQVEFFLWVRTNELYNKKPEIRDAMGLCYAVPNGGMFPKRQNNKGQWWSPVAKKMKAEGMTEGIPDINLDFERSEQCGMHGLRIEMKYRAISLSDKLMVKHRTGEYLVDLSREQKEKRLLFIKGGYKYVICYLAAEAKQAVMDYLPFDKNDYVGV